MKKKVLFLSPLPPPYYGSAMSSQMCLEILQKFNKFEVKNIKLNYSKEINDVGQLNLSKVKGFFIVKKQIKKYRPEVVWVKDKKTADDFSRSFRFLKLFYGDWGLEDIAGTACDVLLLSISGFRAIFPLLAALKAGKRVALANKESVVVGGDLINSTIDRTRGRIVPVDSEHSAIFQMLESQRNRAENLIITSSGGPLFGKKRYDLTPEQALAHPVWSMGRKISIDSATMMNKGLEVIEAHYLFRFPVKKIKILVHPQSIVHSLVEFEDGIILALLSRPDMRIAIRYALTYPERSRVPSGGRLDLARAGKLNFFTPDFKRFPCLKLALQAAEMESGYPVVLNASNEVLVDNFLKKIIRFSEIPYFLEKVLAKHRPFRPKGLEDITALDSWARAETSSLLGKSSAGRRI